jgi:hypothetical protein
MVRGNRIKGPPHLVRFEEILIDWRDQWDTGSELIENEDMIGFIENNRKIAELWTALRNRWMLTMSHQERCLTLMRLGCILEDADRAAFLTIDVHCDDRRENLHFGEAVADSYDRIGALNERIEILHREHGGTLCADLPAAARRIAQEELVRTFGVTDIYGLAEDAA